MNVVYAKQTSHVSTPEGFSVLIIQGTHWPANDPLVELHPDMFSDDPTTGLFFTRPPVTSPPKQPEPDGDDTETATNDPGTKRQATGRTNPRAR